MDTYLDACRREVNQNAVTMPGLTKISSDVLGPKIAISQYQIQKGFLLEHAPRLPLLLRTRKRMHSGTSAGKPNQSNSASAGPAL